MDKIKEINIKDLSDKTLKNILKFKPYDCDKVIIKINSKITMKDIENRVLELNKIHFDLIELLCCQGDSFPSYSDKYNNCWISVDVDDNGDIDSVLNNSEEISDVIRILMCALANEDLSVSIDEYMESKFNDVYCFRKKIYDEKLNMNFNYDTYIQEY